MSRGYHDRGDMGARNAYGDGILLVRAYVNINTRRAAGCWRVTICW